MILALILFILHWDIILIFEFIHSPLNVALKVKVCKDQ